MKIAIPASGTASAAACDERFGRAPYITIVDDETGEMVPFPNPALSSPGGVGIKAAQFLVSNGVKALITGRIGENARTVLEAAGIAIYLFERQGTVEEAYQAFKGGSLPLMKTTTMQNTAGGGSGKRSQMS